MPLVPEIPIAISGLHGKKHDCRGTEEAGVADKIGSLPINLSTPIARRAAFAQSAIRILCADD
jgi:hypothetical protein